MTKKTCENYAQARVRATKITRNITSTANPATSPALIQNRKRPSTKARNTQKSARKKQRINEEDDDDALREFYDAISTKQTEEELELESKRIREIAASVAHQCFFRHWCQNPAVPKKYNCKAWNCPREVHHTCAYHFKLTGYNEMDCYCSQACKDRTETW